jgi:thiol:disulfide interchange protein DsbC
MMRAAQVTLCATASAVMTLATIGSVRAQAPIAASPELSAASAEAEKALHETFTNLKFEEFGPSPVKGRIYQAIAGGKILYFAPESGHILFAAVYDRNGVNVTALAQDASARKRLAALDPTNALIIGPAGAPTVTVFTDPDCPYCRALEKFWATKAAEGKPVRRLVYFVSGIHPQAAAKAEHILCSPDEEAEFNALYAGVEPKQLRTCPAGHDEVAADAEMVRKIGVSGTPTMIVDGKLITGFQQGELEAFLARPAPSSKPPG